MNLKAIVLKDWLDEEEQIRICSLKTKDGQDIEGVYSVNYTINAGDQTGRAVLTLVDPQVYIEAEAEYKLFDYNSGKYKKVKKVVFDDETELNFCT